MRTSLMVVLLVLPAFTALASTDVDVVVGQRYAGGTRVRFSQLGLSFQIPKGWIGTLPEGADFFVMGSETHPGMLLASAEPQSSLPTLKQTLSQPIPLDGQGTVLTPQGQPTVKSGIVRANFTAQSAGQEIIGLARAKVMASKTAVGFIALGPAGQRQPYVKLLNGLLRSLKAVKAPKVAASSGAWLERLRGMALVYMKTSSGLSTKKKMSLCRDGSFAYSSGDSYLSGGFSAVGQGSNTGRWQVQGDRLVLHFAEGGQTTYHLERRGQKTYVDGDRWFLVDEANCR